MQILDGESTEILGAGFAGVCGFGGGFDRQMMTPLGANRWIKAFVQESLDHSLRLEKALNRLTMDKRVVLLHSRRSVRLSKANIRKFFLFWVQAGWKIRSINSRSSASLMGMLTMGDPGERLPPTSRYSMWPSPSISRHNENTSVCLRTLKLLVNR